MKIVGFAKVYLTMLEKINEKSRVLEGEREERGREFINYSMVKNCKPKYCVCP